MNPSLTTLVHLYKLEEKYYLQLISSVDEDTFYFVPVAKAIAEDLAANEYLEIINVQK